MFGMIRFSRYLHTLLLKTWLLVVCAWPTAIQSEGIAEPTIPPAEVAELPSLGDVNTQSLSTRAEKRLGDRIMRSIKQDPQIIDDPLIAEYIDTQWHLLLDSARRQGHLTIEMDDAFAWKSFLVRDKNINAFALPGGYIGIHLGLIAGTRNKDELAAVLAHELSHVTQRHIARMMGDAKRTSWISMASMVLGAIAASRSPEAAQALIVGGQGLSAQSALNFSREMEREADRIGFGVMGQAGFAPEGMMQMFEQLQQAARLNDDNSFPYLRTHPLTVERIGEARSRMGHQNSTKQVPEDFDLYHALIAARAKVLMDPRSLSLEPLLKAPDARLMGKSLLVHQYTRLLAATQLKDMLPASQALAALWPLINSLYSNDAAALRRLLALSEIELLLETGRVPQAQTLLKKSKTTSRPEALLYARSALLSPSLTDNNSLWQAAAAHLQTLITQHPDDANTWALLSALWGKLGYPLRAVRADAEASAARGDLQGAIDRVEAARQRFTSAAHADLIEQSVMDSRLRDWFKTLKEDEKEEN